MHGEQAVISSFIAAGQAHCLILARERGGLVLFLKQWMELLGTNSLYRVYVVDTPNWDGMLIL